MTDLLGRLNFALAMHCCVIASDLRVDQTRRSNLGTSFSSTSSLAPGPTRTYRKSGAGVGRRLADNRTYVHIIINLSCLPDWLQPRWEHSLAAVTVDGLALAVGAIGRSQRRSSAGWSSEANRPS